MHYEVLESLAKPAKERRAAAPQYTDAERKQFYINRMMSIDNSLNKADLEKLNLEELKNVYKHM